MESSLDKKRQIFRADIRRQHIESYQRKIRMQHLKKRQEQSLKMTNEQLTFPQISPQTQLLQLLSAILNLPSNQICTAHNFGIMVESIELGTKTEKQIERITIENWKIKEKLVQIVYRILDKILEEDNHNIYVVVDQIFYLLQYPEMLPLWEKISLLTDVSVKDSSIARFKTLVKENQDMFDPDFIIDIICDFLINDPKPPFEIALELLHFLVERENFFKKSLGKLNKLVFILRNFLKGNNSSARLARLIQQGYQHLILTVMCSVSIKSECKSKQMNSSVQMMTKTNIVKLINDIFNCNSEAAAYLYSICSEVLMASLLKSLETLDCHIKQRYKFIVCKSHGILIKNILETINIILITKSTQLMNPTSDFLNKNGLDYLHKILQMFEIQPKKNESYNGETEKQWKRDILNILQSVETSYFLLDFGKCILYSQLLHQLLQTVNFVEDREIGARILKLMKNMLINAYARATEPELFQELSSQILYTVNIRSLLEWISKMGGLVQFLAREILAISDNPRQYFYQHNHFQN